MPNQHIHENMPCCAINHALVTEKPLKRNYTNGHIVTIFATLHPAAFIQHNELKQAPEQAAKVDVTLPPTKLFHLSK